MASDIADRGSLSERIAFRWWTTFRPARWSRERCWTRRRWRRPSAPRGRRCADAIRQLEAAGLVEIRPRRGIVVLPITLPRAPGDVRGDGGDGSALHPLRDASHDRHGARQLLAMHDESADLAASGDFARYDAFNLAFHEAIYRATHNEFLVEQALQLRGRLLPFRRTQLRYPDRLATSRAEHGAILKAVMRGEADEASKVMREHMLNAGAALARYLKLETPV